MTFDELEKRPVVLLSDEAHHLSAATKADKKEQEAEKTWEYTVSRLLNAHEDNLLLEFTATCDLRHPALKAAYEPRIVFDYPLSRFREDGYSKEIKTLRSDLPVMDKALQALMLSQYRLKLFEEHLLAIKPVVLFKSLNIADSRRSTAGFSAALPISPARSWNRWRSRGARRSCRRPMLISVTGASPLISWPRSCSGNSARPAACR